ncbi:MAG: exodeoxyribonuclease VII small subunit [Halobacteriales archaeon]|nr:exodeoxyribonuclease VII small subunit [Halobacteriales archaeon]
MTGTGAFEAKLGELEQVVRALEEGDLPLEQALERFEQGVALVRDLRQRLDQARLRVQLLQEDGSLREAPELVPG